MLREWVAKKDLNYDDLLFPGNKTGLSDFVNKMNKKIGIQHGGIDYIRQSKISQELKAKEYSPEKRVELARLMKHSPVAQLKYVRLLKES